MGNIENLFPILKDSNQRRQMKEKVDELLTSIVNTKIAEIGSLYSAHQLSIKLITTLKEIDLNSLKFQGTTAFFTPAKQGPGSPSLFRTPADTVPVPIKSPAMDRNEGEVPVQSQSSMRNSCCFCCKASKKGENDEKITPAEQPVQLDFQTPARPSRSPVGLAPSTGKRSEAKYEIDVIVLFFDKLLDQRFKEDLYHASVKLWKLVSSDDDTSRNYKQHVLADCVQVGIQYDVTTRSFLCRLENSRPETAKSNELEIISLEDSPSKVVPFVVDELGQSLAQKCIFLVDLSAFGFPVGVDILHLLNLHRANIV